MGFTSSIVLAASFGLGEGLLASGRLSEASQDRALQALAVCAGKIRRREVTLARSVATEACRRAANGARFIERVYEETGIALDVITPAEEARLAVLGCQALIEPRVPDGIVFDIGGGSTELVLVRPGANGQAEVRAWVSLPWGVISLAETETTGIETREGRLEAYARSHGRVSEALAAFAERIAPMLDGRRPQLLGTSGTVTTLAALQMGLPAYDRTRVGTGATCPRTKCARSGICWRASLPPSADCCRQSGRTART